MRTKLIFFSCLLVLLVMTLIHPRVSHPSRADAVTITFSFWGSYLEWNMWRDIATGFEAKNPDVHVKLNYIPGGYDDKIRLLLAADSAPDVMMIQDEPFPGYAAYGKFADLTEYASGPGVEVDWNRDLWPTAADSFLYKGRYMGMPVFGGNVLIYYNRAMFRKLGVAEPSENWTYDDFIAKAKELTRDLNGDGRPDTFGFTVPHWIYYLPWTWGFGADYLNAAKTDWAFTGPAALDSTRFYQDLRFTYRVAPSIQEIPTAQEGAMFMTGRIGMLVGGPWTGLDLTTGSVDFDVAHMPIGPSGKRFTRVTWDSLCLFNKSPHKKEAWRFMAYCISPEGQAVVGQYLRSIPALMSAKKDFVNPDNGWREERFFEALDYARMQPITVKWDPMRQVMDSTYEQLLLDKLTPEQTVKNLAAELRAGRVFPLEARP